MSFHPNRQNREQPAADPFGLVGARVVTGPGLGIAASILPCEIKARLARAATLAGIRSRRYLPVARHVAATNPYHHEPAIPAEARP